MSLPKEEPVVLQRVMMSVLILCLMTLALFGLRTISNADVWQHLALGRAIAEKGLVKTDALTFTMENRPWVNTSWLYDLLVYGLWTIGQAPLLILLTVVVTVAAFVVVLPVARRWAGASAVGAALILSAWLLAPQFVVGPAAFGLLFAAVFIRVLAGSHKSWVNWVVLVPVQILWANMHESFLAGPVLCAVYVADIWFGSKAKAPDGIVPPHVRTRTLDTAWLVPGTFIACVLNPFGPALLSDVIGVYTNLAFVYAQEWISPFSGQFPASLYAKHVVTLALLIGAGGLVTERRKLPVALTTLAVLGAFLVVRSMRFIDVFALLAFPFLSLSLSAIGRYLREMLPSVMKDREPVTLGITVVLALLSALAVASSALYTTSGSASRFGLGVEYDLFPSAASTLIARPDFPRRAVNMTHDGGFLAWRNPGRQIFVDQRADLFGAQFYRTFNRYLVGEQSAWTEIEDKWDPGAVIINCCVPGAGAAVRNLAVTKRWSLAYFDGTTAILVRSVSENEALANNRDIQKEGLFLLERERVRYANQLRSGGRTTISPRLIGAGDVFLALGRYNEAKSIYSLLAAGSPSMGLAWMALGIAETQLGEDKEAVRALNRAASLMPKNVWAWLYLHRAAAKANDVETAGAALQKAKRLNETAVSMFLNEGEPESISQPRSRRPDIK